jgi:protein TonB
MTQGTPVAGIRIASGHGTAFSGQAYGYGARVLRLTSPGVGLATLGCSVVVHATVLLAPMGHSSAARVSLADVVDVDLLTEVPTLPDEPEPSAPPAGHAASWHTHTHPYPMPPGHDATPHDPNLVHLPFPGAPSQATPAAPQPAAPVETATSDTPHFTMAFGASASDVHGPVSAAGTASVPSHDDDAVFPEPSVDAPARRASGPSPVYPDAARADGIEGDVRLELIVGRTGVVESARVVRGIGHGLDDAALRASRKFRFTPATRGGHPVRVRMGWSMQFRLQ